MAWTVPGVTSSASLFPLALCHVDSCSLPHAALLHLAYRVPAGLHFSRLWPVLPTAVQCLSCAEASCPLSRVLDGWPGLSRWDENWIIHLDGVFQTSDRVGDHHVHVALGMRRVVICDTMADVEEGYEGAQPLSAQLWTSAQLAVCSMAARVPSTHRLVVCDTMADVQEGYKTCAACWLIAELHLRAQLAVVLSALRQACSANERIAGVALRALHKAQPELTWAPHAQSTWTLTPSGR